MNSTAEQLDHYLREADPATARTVERIVGLLIQRFQSGNGSEQSAVNGVYRIKTHHMGAFQPGFDPRTSSGNSRMTSKASRSSSMSIS